MKPHVVAIHKDASGHVIKEITGATSVRMEPVLDMLGNMLSVQQVTTCTFTENVTFKWGETLTLFQQIDIKSR